ncbi:IS701 family transposase [Kitasatospora phosalacinea]|uniref:ISXo8 transposase n=1 Tax=Kitasatospora phosalacinea TaxID=2065 RepID=A0A9W6PLB8_9ACTN|nr:transposase [Kitasatospora phosalacinea]GLW56989.1 putative ISXo8 transposase [Kitasatospora phosalacinea]
MSDFAPHLRDTLAPGRSRLLDSSHDIILSELGAVLFASLPRADQRRKGTEYLRGLLGAQGRKSVRNIARLIGGQATEQNLHHFISSSTWDWDPVRAALAHYLRAVAPPQAWVVQQTVIPKAGEHSVGVDRQFISSVGQVLNAQQAVGVWSASADVSMPVNWRLHLSRAWLDDVPRRSQASIPASVTSRTLEDCAVEAVTELTADWRLPTLPVVMDVRELDGAKAVNLLRAAGLPFVLRIASTLLLRPAEGVAGAGSSGNEVMPAHRIAGAWSDRRRVVAWHDPDREGGPATALVGAVRVRTAGDPAVRAGAAQRLARGGGLLLLGTGTPGRRWPQELWLTDLPDLPPAQLFRLSQLIGRVERDFEEIADRTGVRDYAGRSFNGWHRHVTLASAAHAVAALAHTGGRTLRRVS